MQRPYGITILIIGSILLILTVSCGPAGTPTLATSNVSVTKITEGDIVTSDITQNKTFDQCNSASPFKAQIQFSQSENQTSQQELILGGSIGGEVGLSEVAKVTLQGTIEQHFASSQDIGQGHQESAAIEVPPHTQQEYTIVWRESRRNGTVEYIENGDTKTVDFSYRIGLELVSSNVQDISCPGQETVQSSVEASPTPQAIVVTPTSAPLPTTETNTSPGTHLKVGDTWKQDGVYLTLTKTSFDDFQGKGEVWLSFDIANHTGNDLTVSFDIRNIILETNTGVRFRTFYSEPQGALWKDTITSDDRKEVFFYYSDQYSWLGDYYSSDVSYILVTVRDWSRISEAVWQIDIQH